MAGIYDNVHAADDRLRTIVERIERLNEESDALKADIKEVYSEAKSDGYCSKTIKQVIKERLKTENERSEQISMFDLYWERVHG
tara:strand:+ start:7408 stop:7659 length:252 start_codon:yes stop_codon:yes gene_type:complete